MIIIITIAFLIGCATVTSNLINFRAAKALGTYNGSLVNYITASIVSFILLLINTGFHPDFRTYASAPLYLYTGGTFGVIAFVLTMICLAKMKVFLSTTLALAGQLLAGLVFDAIMFQNLTPIKLLGIALIASGIFLDRKVSAADAANAEK